MWFDSSPYLPRLRRRSVRNGETRGVPLLQSQPPQPRSGALSYCTTTYKIWRERVWWWWLRGWRWRWRRYTFLKAIQNEVLACRPAINLGNGPGLQRCLLGMNSRRSSSLCSANFSRLTQAPIWVMTIKNMLSDWLKMCDLCESLCVNVQLYRLFHRIHVAVLAKTTHYT